MKEHLKNFALLTGSTLIMAVGIYFSSSPTTSRLAVSPVLRYSLPSSLLFRPVIFLHCEYAPSDHRAFRSREKFAAQSAYSSILLSVTLSGLERIYPMSHPLTNEPLLELIFAIVLPAIGSAILFNIGASSGGTDVIAMILKKYTSVDIGKGLLPISYSQSPVSSYLTLRRVFIHCSVLRCVRH